MAPDANKKVFVLMPHSAEYQGDIDEADFIYKHIITPGVEGALGKGIKPEREVDKSRAGLITKSIVEHLATADLVIVDITGHNPNVFLELGMRYALRDRVTIVLAQDGTVIPFDMRGYRLIFYNRFKVESAQRQITEFIKSGIEDGAGSDSIVFDTFKSLVVTIPGRVQSRGDAVGRGRDVMSWDEYQGKVEAIMDWLRPAVNEGHYVPDAVLGISNGGMIVADLLGKAVFAGRDTPILALWAHRYTRGQDYFANQYNDALMDTLKRTKRKPLTVMIVDDHFASGNTARQALEYVKARLGQDTRVLFVPLVSRRRDHVRVLEEFLPYGYRDNGVLVFDIDRDAFLRSIDTRAGYFPYLRKQVSEGLEQIEEPVIDQGRRPVARGDGAADPGLPEGRAAPPV